MLSLLQRLHKLSVKEDLQSHSERQIHEIHSARLDSHKKIDGHSNMETYNVNLSDNEIFDTLVEAEQKAKTVVNTLDMAEDLKKKNKWDIPPISLMMQRENENDEDVNDEGDVTVTDVMVDSEIWDTTSSAEVIDDISKLHANNIVDTTLVEKAKRLAKRKESLDLGVSVYHNIANDSSNSDRPLFVSVKVGEKEVFIRKRTAVWLFNDSERVSSDRIF
jgi:hypothetical protein